MGEAIAFPVPAPRHGEVFADPRDDGRALRVSWHPEQRTVVLSLWRGDRCVGTHRVEGAEIGRLVHALVDGLADAPTAVQPG